MRVGERLKAISIAAEATGESKTSEAQVLAQECFMKLGVFTGSDMDYEGSMKALNQCIQAGVEAGPFFDKIPTFREYMGKVYPYQMKGYLLVLSTHSDWDPSQFRGEEQYLEGMQFYNHQVCSRHMKEMWHFDAYRACFNAGAAVLFHGNFNAVDDQLSSQDGVLPNHGRLCKRLHYSNSANSRVHGNIAASGNLVR